jgi:hypothetical protein
MIATPLSKTWRCAVTLVLAGSAATAIAGDPDSVTAGWLGAEMKILASEQDDHVPNGGKVTLVYDSSDDIYRACARQTTTQQNKWRGDWASPCAVTLQLTKGARYCTLADVKAGNAEVLASCHRLRSRDVVMHPTADARGDELHDVIVFLLEPVAPSTKGGIAILLDSPARVTHNGIIHGGP